MTALAAGVLLRFATGATSLQSDDEPPIVIDRESARDAAERELSRPEYQDAKPGLVRRALDWLVEQVGRLLSTTADVSPGGWVGVLVVAALVALLIVVARLRLGSFRRTASDTPQQLFAADPRSARTHRDAAERLALAARWDEALQERMRAVVRSLEEDAVLDHKPGRTAGEAAVEAGRAMPELASALASAARSFDEVTYAHRPANAASYNQVKDLDKALTSRAPTFATSHGSGGRT